MRYFSNTAANATIQNPGGISAAATSLILSTQTGMPAVPFSLLLDGGLATAEIVTVTAGLGTAGTPYTITRASDGTIAATHALGATAVHTVTARDLQEPQAHIDNVTPGSPHGLPSSAWNQIQTVIKTTDQGIASTTTLQSDIQMKVNVVSGATYEIEVHYIYTSLGGDLVTQWSVPVGTTGPAGITAYRACIGPASDIGSKTASNGNFGCYGFSNNALYGGVGLTNGSHSLHAQENAIIVAGATGLLTVQWGQNVSSADTLTMRAGSYIKATRVI